jgi:hypothetical protein
MDQQIATQREKENQALAAFRALKALKRSKSTRTPVVANLASTSGTSFPAAKSESSTNNRDEESQDWYNIPAMLDGMGDGITDAKDVENKETIVGLKIKHGIWHTHGSIQHNNWHKKVKHDIWHKPPSSEEESEFID